MIAFVPSVIKTNMLLKSDDHPHKDFLLQRYRERIEKLSQQDRLRKFCMDAWSLNVVEIGQYFRTKDTAEFSQFTDAVVMKFNNNEQETSEVQFEEYASRLNTGDFASRSKTKAKPQRRDLASSSTRTNLIGEKFWTDVETGDYSISDYEVSKKLINLLRHGSLRWEDDGATEFWRMKDNHQKHFLYCHHWYDEKWKGSMARGGGNK